MSRNTHDRNDIHFGTWTANLAALTEAVGRDLPAGMTLEAALKAINDRITELENGNVRFFRLSALLRVTHPFNLFRLFAVITRTVTHPGSFTFDAVLSLPRAGSFTFDAMKRVTATATFTLDSIRRVTQAASFTLDAIVGNPPTTVYSLDAVLRRTATGTFAMDAVIGTATAGGFTGQLGTVNSKLANIELGVG